LEVSFAFFGKRAEARGDTEGPLLSTRRPADRFGSRTLVDVASLKGYYESLGSRPIISRLYSAGGRMWFGARATSVTDMRGATILDRS
jgi:hypothetical protein